MFSWNSISLILVSFQTNVSLTTAQLSAFCLRAHCRTGKNDLNDKMVCRLVHDDCNMCGVDVYYLPPSFRSLAALFFLLPFPSFLSSFLLSAPVFPLFLSGSNQSLAQTLSRSRKGVWCSEQLFLPHGVGSLSNLRMCNLSESSQVPDVKCNFYAVGPSPCDKERHSEHQIFLPLFRRVWGQD